MQRLYTFQNVALHSLEFYTDEMCTDQFSGPGRAIDWVCGLIARLPACVSQMIFVMLKTGRGLCIWHIVHRDPMSVSVKGQGRRSKFTISVAIVAVIYIIKQAASFLTNLSVGQGDYRRCLSRVSRPSQTRDDYR